MDMTPTSRPEPVLSPFNFLWGYSDSGRRVCVPGSNGGLKGNSFGLPICGLLI